LALAERADGKDQLLIVDCQTWQVAKVFAWYF
jgi:hypothetical protein